MLNINRVALHSVGKFVTLRFFVFIILLAQGTAVFAHSLLTMDSATPPRYNSDSLKDKSLPCGAIGVLASTTDMKSIFDVGSTITLTWKETVNHTGHFLFDFSAANDNFGPVQEIVVDDSIAMSDARNVQFLLPDATCENCTVRLRQTMFMPVPAEPNYDPTTDTRITPYFSCADIAIVDKTLTDVPPAVTGIQTSGLVTPTNLTLTWTNPASGQFSEVVIVRKQLQNSTSNFDDTLTNFVHYPVGTSVNNDVTLVVVYRGTQNSFQDSGLMPETSYGYKVFARNANYNYNQGSMQVVTTAATGSDGSGGGTTTTAGSNDSGGGSFFSMLLLLFGLFSGRIILAKVTV